MQPTNLRAAKTRVAVHLITVIVVLLVTIFFAGCTNNSNQKSNSPQSSTTPSPTPTPSGSPGPKRVPGDTIIIIRDGSVHMKVNKEDMRCEDDGFQGNRKHYKCKDVTLKEIGINSVSGPTCVALSENSTIKINGGGGTDQDITIERNGNHVRISFDKDKYKECQGGSPGEHCGENHVGTISVNEPRTDPFFTKTCRSGETSDKCEFWIRIKPR